MCFRRKSTMKKATKPIYAYKGLNVREGHNIKERILISPYRSDKVWKEKERCIEEEFEKKSTARDLYDGFHSCKTAEDASYHSDFVYKFVIPKGSYYYENNTEYLSNQIYLQSTKCIQL